MQKDEILKILKGCDAIKEGHFLLSSGRHSPFYVQCALLFQYPDITEKLVKEIVVAELVPKGPLFGALLKEEIDLIIGPATGAIILSFELARLLKRRAVFAEREEEKMKLRRSFKINRGERVLIVEDVITTGDSTKMVIELVRREGGIPVGVAAIVERSREPVDFGLKKSVLLPFPLEDYSPEDCPLCKQHLPLIKPGGKR